MQAQIKVSCRGVSLVHVNVFLLNGFKFFFISCWKNILASRQTIIIIWLKLVLLIFMTYYADAGGLATGCVRSNCCDDILNLINHNLDTDHCIHRSPPAHAQGNNDKLPSASDITLTETKLIMTQRKVKKSCITLWRNERSWMLKVLKDEVF